jgi:hypothetical protein
MSAGTDNNYASFADRDGVRASGITFDPTLDGLQAAAFSDILKFSNLTNSVFEGGVVVATGAKENAIDANRNCSNVRVHDFLLFGGRQAAIVCKGGCKQMVFSKVTIYPDSSAKVDVIWDDWSDQSKAPSTGSLTDVRRADGKPVRVAFGRFNRPQIVGGNCKIDWVRTAGMHVYNYVLRPLGIR